MNRMVGRNWLADSISKAERILDPLLAVLLNSSSSSFTQIFSADNRKVFEKVGRQVTRFRISFLSPFLGSFLQIKFEFFFFVTV